MPVWTRSNQRDWNGTSTPPSVWCPLCVLGAVRMVCAHCAMCVCSLCVGCQHGRCALHWAAEKHSVEIAALLITEGAAVDLRDNGGAGVPRNSGGCTPLHICAQHNSAEIAQLLIGAGATVDAPTANRGSKGITPLQICCSKPYVSCAADPAAIFSGLKRPQ